MNGNGRVLNTLLEHMTAAPAAVHLMNLDGAPRAFLTPSEFATVCGIADGDRVCALIRDGVIHSARDLLKSRHHLIPVSEIARIQTLTAGTAT